MIENLFEKKEIENRRTISKRKPCPFCGGNVELIENVVNNYSCPPLGINNTWWFKCNGCRWIFNYTYDNKIREKFEHMEFLIEKFNTRV